MNKRIVEKNGDFVCLHCRNFVSSASILSGVHNRNHCPYCLSSRHLDLYQAGDRLSACKAKMEPIGLTFKRSNKKYRNEQHGELMLIHACTDCEAVSLNRIAADDDIQRVVEIVDQSARLNHQVRSYLDLQGINLLKITEMELVQKQLLGVGSAAYAGLLS